MRTIPIHYFPNMRLRPWVAVLSLLLVLGGCSSKAEPPATQIPEVSVIKAVATPVTLFDEYVAQTEAVDTVEIRARVTGVLERQAFEDGGRVKKGDLLFVIDQQPFITALAQAKAALAQATASFINSQQNLARVRPLAAEQSISQQDLDAAIAKERADAASVEAARAAVRQAELNLDYTTIRAPRNGVMSKALVKPGALITPAQTLMTTLYSIDPIYVNFTISEQRLLELNRTLQGIAGEQKDGAPPFRLKLVDGSDYQFSGKLNFVDAAVDAKSGTLEVRISVPNPDRFLRPGQFVRVVMPAAETSAIRVPQKAVQELQGTHSVLVVGSDSKVAARQIAVSSRAGGDWVIKDGLAPGEMVIVDGIQKARPGSAVQPVPASSQSTVASETAPDAKQDVKIPVAVKPAS